MQTKTPSGHLVRLLTQGAFAGLVMASGAAPLCAQSWPQRTVRIILPLGAGSGTDIGARLLADKLIERWGRPVIVENRPGGDGIIAINAFIGANDDHTLLFAPSGTFTTHPFVRDKVRRRPRPSADSPGVEHGCRNRRSGDAERQLSRRASGVGARAAG